MNAFEDYMVATAYKKTVGKPNTSPLLSATEEFLELHRKVELGNIWVDSKYIPVSAPIVLNGNNIYTVKVFDSVLEIIQKIDKLRLTLKEGTRATYHHEYLADAIPHDFGDGYQYTLTDVNGQVVPFGLNNWVLDPESATLSFMEGIPEGYDKVFYITFYRYVGRKGDTSLIKNDGSSVFIDGYTPIEKQNPANKDYVDKEINKLGIVVEKMVPPIPPTFDGGDLSLSSVDLHYGNYLLTNEHLPFVFFNSEFRIDIPQFYNSGKGTVSVMVNGAEADSFDLFDAMLAGAYGKNKYIIVDENDDPYRTDFTASGFYKSIKCHLALTSAALSPAFIPTSPVLEIYLKYTLGSISFKTNAIRFGFEEAISEGVISHFFLDKYIPVTSEKFISGIPAITEGDKITAHTTFQILKEFKQDKVARLSIPELAFDTVYAPLQKYTILGESHDASSEITIPSGLYSESVSYKAICYDVLGNENGYADFIYNLRVDSISDETKRVTSGVGSLPTLGYGQVFDSKADLHNNEELMLRGGYYQFPKGSYIKNNVIPVGHFTLNGISQGVTYEDIADGRRYATFMFANVPLCNGMFILFDALENAHEDDLTHELADSISVQVKIEDLTGWLNANASYDGVAIPRDDEAPCLVSTYSTLSKRRITFGNKVVAGNLFVRVGLKKGSVRFKGVSIQPL
jgi:hypothetical protein